MGRFMLVVGLNFSFIEIGDADKVRGDGYGDSSTHNFGPGTM